MAVQGIQRSRDGARSSFKRQEDMEGERNRWRNGAKGSLFHVRTRQSGIIISQTFLYFTPSCKKEVGRVCGNSMEHKPFAESLLLCTIT